MPKLVFSKSWLYAPLFVIIYFLSPACKTRTIAPARVSPPCRIKNLLVLPFENMAAKYTKAGTVRCPLCGNVFMAEKFPEKVSGQMTYRLESFIKTRTKFNPIFTDITLKNLRDTVTTDKIPTNTRNLLVEAGQNYGADAVLAGYIYRFRQRIGSRFAAESPASVSFGIHLICVSDGRILWSGCFDETQHALSENLFMIGTFLKRKASWITAEDMAYTALEKLLQTLPEP